MLQFTLCDTSLGVCVIRYVCHSNLGGSVSSDSGRRDRRGARAGHTALPQQEYTANVYALVAGVREEPSDLLAAPLSQSAALFLQEGCIFNRSRGVRLHEV